MSGNTFKQAFTAQATQMFSFHICCHPKCEERTRFSSLSPINIMENSLKVVVAYAIDVHKGQVNDEFVSCAAQSVNYISKHGCGAN